MNHISSLERDHAESVMTSNEDAQSEPRNPPKIVRQWTHSLENGSKEPRLHKKDSPQASRVKKRRRTTTGSRS